MNNCQSMIELLSDEYMMKIMHATRTEPLSITEISREYDIPITACYRRIEFLKDMEFIEEAGTRISSKNRKMILYSSVIEKIDMRFENGQMIFETEDITGRTFSAIKDVLSEKEGVCTTANLDLQQREMPVETLWDI